jgi:hypothetical protein
VIEQEYQWDQVQAEMKRKADEVKAAVKKCSIL